LSADEIGLGEAGALLGRGPDDLSLAAAGHALKGKGGRTLAYRLFKAGVIAGRQPGPRVLYLSRASVLAWRERTRAADFWESADGVRIRELLKGY